ncbi:MAG: DNA-directed RNA polymerase subunit alpha [Planctomycetaceae bacterium]|jgi:DNA-directed RNA polymerase subunit alpha|nr:DNA-directed RNA polymerase subunit alpha [Planctomycetaceae bacterium]
MHLSWRGLDLPASVQVDQRSRTQTFARFTAEPFEPGFGTTVGNSLRRVLLSAIEGAAITKVKIKGVTHEFSTIPGVLEDVVDIILNIKGVVIAMDGDGPKTMRLSAEGPGDVTAELIECDASIQILNPDKVIATLTDKIDFDVEFTVEKGRGYLPASEQIAKDGIEGKDQVVGEIPIDAIFSPVQRVRFSTEDTRLGQQTNYQKLILDIWTNGTVTPEMALVEGAKILRKHLNPFVQFDELGMTQVSDEVAASNEQDDEIIRKLRAPVSELELSVRASNCLETAKIRTVGELVQRSEDDLLGVRSFGKTSLREVKQELEKLGLHLGYPVPDGLLNG